MVQNTEMPTLAMPPFFTGYPYQGKYRQHAHFPFGITLS